VTTQGDKDIQNVEESSKKEDLGTKTLGVGKEMRKDKGFDGTECGKTTRGQIDDDDADLE